MSAHHSLPDSYLLIWNWHLHIDGFLMGVALIWSVLGTAVYLFSHGLREGPKQALTVLCGPSAWVWGIYKNTLLRRIRKGMNPPPVPKKWTMPREFERG